MLIVVKGETIRYFVVDGVLERYEIQRVNVTVMFVLDSLSRLLN